MKPLVRRNQMRRGVELIEFALVLPIIALMLFGAIEAARAVMVAHTLQEAAQAGCRVYSVKGTTKAQATAVIAEAMKNARITKYQVTFKPSRKGDVDTSGEPVTVTVAASFADVAWFSPGFMAGKSLKGSCVFPADINVSDGGDKNGYNVLLDDNVLDGLPRD